MESEAKIRGRKWNGSRSEREINKKNYNEMDVFQVSGDYRTYNSEKRESKVKNTEYGRDSLENIESHGEKSENIYL